MENSDNSILRRSSVPSLQKTQYDGEYGQENSLEFNYLKGDNSCSKRFTFSAPSLRRPSINEKFHSAPATPTAFGRTSSNWTVFSNFKNEIISTPGSSATRSSSSQDGEGLKENLHSMTQANSVSRGPADPEGSAGAPLGTKNMENAEVMQTSRSSKARQKKFHRHFKQVDNEEKVLNYYSCALVGDILLQGHLYITENFFAFYSNVFGYVTKLLIPAVDVLKISKEKTAKIIPNAVGISTEDEKHVFGSLLSRDSTYKFMLEVWKAANSSQPVINIPPSEAIKPEPSDEDSTGSSANDEPTSYITSLSSRSAQGINLQNLFPRLKKPTDQFDIKGTNEHRLSARATAALIILVTLLAFLFASAGYLLYRISLIQTHLTIKDLSLSSKSSEFLYEDILRWQSTLHSTSANKIQEFLTMNLNQIIKIRLSLEALSTLILPKSNDSEKPVTHPSWTTLKTKGIIQEMDTEKRSDNP